MRASSLKAQDVRNLDGTRVLKGPTRSADPVAHGDGRGPGPLYINVDIYRITYILAAMVSEDTLLAALGNASRRRLLMLLATFGELCVCELVHAVDLPQATVSRHLATVRQARLVEARRQGTWMYYRFAREVPSWVLDIVNALQAGPAGALYREDKRRLRAMPNRPARCCDYEEERSS